MNLLLTLRVANRALAKNKLRAGLTVLGIVIGVAAVIAMVSIGQGASAMVQQQFQNLGTNVLFVVPGSQRGGAVRRGAGSIVSLTSRDAEAIARDCPTVLAQSPVVGMAGQAVYGSSNWYPKEMYGVGVDYLTVRNWQLRTGGFFADRDVHSAAKVCVIGRTVVGKLFQTTDPIGKQIRIKNVPFTVIGVLEAKGANMVGDDQDDIMLMPFTTVRKRLRGSTFDNIDAVLISARTASGTADTQREVANLLRERHHIAPGNPDDFQVLNSSEFARALGVVTGVMTMLLAAIAGISLVVGGVGIMNIMLVSVTERTREIGIRLAVGARSRDILRQFLVEAILLATLGGLVGVVIGIGFSITAIKVINSITSGTKWPVVVSLPAIAIALAFSGAVGMFFGFYPARKASRLDPIDALRYE